MICHREAYEYRAVELRFFHTLIFLTSAPQTRRYQKEPVNGA